MMVTLLIGDLNAGKTSKALENIHTGKWPTKTKGFLSVKCYEEEQFLGYDLLDLSSGVRSIFMRTSKDFIKAPVELMGQIGPFLYDQRVFDQVRHALLAWAKEGTYPLIIDEIGRLELMGAGYDSLLRELLTLDGELYLLVRRAFVEKVMDHYGILAPRMQYI